MTESAPSTAGGQTIRVARVVPAAADVVYAAWTQPARAKQWWGETEKSKLIACEIDLRAGGTYLYAVQKAGQGGQSVATGVFREVFPPRQLVFSWNVEQPQVRDSTVTIEFADLRDGSCRVSVVHQGLPDRTLAVAQQCAWADILQDLAVFCTEKAAA